MKQSGEHQRGGEELRARLREVVAEIGRDSASSEEPEMSARRPRETLPIKPAPRGRDSRD